MKAETGSSSGGGADGGGGGCWALTALTFLLHRQVVGLFNKYRIWRGSAKEGRVKGHHRL